MGFGSGCNSRPQTQMHGYGTHEVLGELSGRHQGTVFTSVKNIGFDGYIGTWILRIY